MSKKAVKVRSRADQFAELTEAAKGLYSFTRRCNRKTNRDADFDPEDANAYQSDSEGEGQDGGEDEARAHYETVGYGKSTIAGIVAY